MPKVKIGIITVPLSPGRKYFKVCGDGYIASSHAEWLERAGIDIVAIPYDTDNHKYYFDIVNGLYLPSGGAFASTQLEYYNSCKKFIQLAMEANNKGIYFPIWGGCMGMQQMMIMADGRDDVDFLDKYDSFNNLMLPLVMTKKGLKGKMMTYVREKHPETLTDLIMNDTTLNNHMMGVSPYKFHKSKALNAFYNIVSWNYDRQGKKFVSTIEGKLYPFYGVQWHPERSNHADALANFLESELQKNTHNKTFPKNKALQYKKVDCMNYSNQLYNHCNFYWHKKTSEHNRNLCNVLNLGQPTNNAV
jgi:gamma-glutamyl hydrolase